MTEDDSEAMHVLSYSDCAVLWICKFALLKVKCLNIA